MFIFWPIIILYTIHNFFGSTAGVLNLTKFTIPASGLYCYTFSSLEYSIDTVLPSVFDGLVFVAYVYLQTWLQETAKSLRVEGFLKWHDALVNKMLHCEGKKRLESVNTCSLVGYMASRIIRLGINISVFADFGTCRILIRIIK